MSGLSVSSAALGSPNTTYSGPPPPYSYAPSNTGSSSAPSGRLSPPDSCRRSLREDKGSPATSMSLPSIYEALGDNGISYPTAPAPSMSAPISQPTNSAPPSAMSQNFADPPKGPANPFSQPVAPASAYRDSSSANQNIPSQIPRSQEVRPSRPAFTSVNETDRRAQSSQTSEPARSPRLNAASIYPSGLHNRPGLDPVQDMRSPCTLGLPRSDFTFQLSYSNGQSPFTPGAESLQFERPLKAEHAGSAFHSHDPTRPYGDSVKRHLDVYDAELALDEVCCSSSYRLVLANVIRLAELRHALSTSVALGVLAAINPVVRVIFPKLCPVCMNLMT